jgi:2-oxoglutarate ferredoxin oxidoreductase subunit beta
VHDPEKVTLLRHERGLQISPAMASVYRRQLEHDPSDLSAAREVATSLDPIPIGILYRNPDVPCYEDLRRPSVLRTSDLVRTGLEAELDKVTIWPRRREERL